MSIETLRDRIDYLERKLARSRDLNNAYDDIFSKQLGRHITICKQHDVDINMDFMCDLIAKMSKRKFEIFTKYKGERL